MHPELTRLVAEDHQRELNDLPPAGRQTSGGSLRSRGAQIRRFVLRRLARGPAAPGQITIRSAAPRDAAAVRRLALLEEQPVPAGQTLVAEVDERVVAALAIEDGHAVADPFTASSDVIALLEFRAAQLAA